MSFLSRVVARALFFPTIFWNLSWQRLILGRRWWDEVCDEVVLGALPFRRHAKRLAELGVRAVVNTCDEYDGPTREYAEHGITQLHIPTVDFTPPSLEDVTRAVDFMREHIAAGERIYVHCKAGRARSATVVMCWLIAERGMSPEEAQAFLVEKRPQVLKSVHRREVVRRFAERAASPS